MSIAEQNRTLKVSENKSLSDKDILKMLSDKGVKANLIMYEDLANMTYDNLMSKSPLIILLNIVGDGAPKVGHWICLLEKDHYLEHFDSYGLSPDQELHITHEHPHLSRIYQGRKVEVNKTRLQQMKDHVNTCGRHVVSRILMQHKPLKEYVKWLTSMHQNPDMAVTLITMHM